MPYCKHDRHIKGGQKTIAFLSRFFGQLPTSISRGRHWRGQGRGGGQDDGGAGGGGGHRPPGNFRFHDKNCVTCKRMTDGRTQYSSSKTSRQYNISRHYTCKSRYIVYLVTCTLCQKQYCGQTRRSMAERHRNHRSEVKTAADGLGAHFHQHLLDRGVDPKADNNIELIITYFDFVIVVCVNR